jgi:hypothetical protein
VHKTVASRPKILQNNSKPAVEKNCLQRAAISGEKCLKSGRKKIFFVKNWFLRGVFASKSEFVPSIFLKIYTLSTFNFYLK